MGDVKITSVFLFKLKQMMDGEVGNNNSDSEDDVANMITEGWGNRETR